MLIFLVLISAWAIIKANLKFFHFLHLQGKGARIFGALTLLFSLVLIPSAIRLTIGLLNEPLIDRMDEESYWWTVLEFAIQLGTVIGIAFFCKRFNPKQLTDGSADQPQ